MKSVSPVQAPMSDGSLPPQGRYRHFKGGEYELLHVGQHSETEQWLVVYRDCSDPERTWVRPLAMWNESVEAHSGKMLRFELVHPSSRRRIETICRGALSKARSIRGYTEGHRRGESEGRLSMRQSLRHVLRRH